MGPYGNKNFKTLLLLQSPPKVFKLFLNFLPNGPHKTALGFLKFEILTFFFSFSLIWDPIGVKISRRYSYKKPPNVLKLVLNFPLNFPYKSTVGIFEI